MTAPITGPFTVTRIEYAPPTSAGYRADILEEARTWYRQKTPYNQPLDFTHYKRWVLTTQSGTSDRGEDPNYRETISSIPTVEALDQNLYNRVYAKFKEKVRDSASVGVSLAERRQAMSMMENRLFQMARFTNAVRRGRFGDAAKELGVRWTVRKNRKAESRHTSKDPRERARSFANNYLEFHFGWSPLLADIHNAAEVLSSPVWPRPISASRVIHRYGTGGSYYQLKADNMISSKSVIHHLRQQVTLRAELSVTNPNLLLAEQLGLVNPATIAWELVPFSFVLDWFVNVGDFLSQFTDFAGVSLTNQHRTIFSERTHGEEEFIEYNKGNPLRTDPLWINNGYYTSYKRFVKMNFSTQRIVGSFPGPTLQVRDPWVLSPRRGLAAVSLLIQSMPRQEVKAARPVISRRSSIYRGRIAESYWHL